MIEARNPHNEAAFWEEIQNSFPRSSKYINLVNTGGGSVPKATLDQLAALQIQAAGNGESEIPALEALKESGSSKSLRELMASTFGCSANEIALTRNAMEGLGIGLLGIDLEKNDEILTTNADYDTCIRIIQQREQRDGIQARLIDLPMPSMDDEDIVEAFEHACTDQTRVILMSHMINKNGQILPVRKVTDMARARGITTIVDGAQSIGQINFRISDLGCDVFSTSLHKWFYAPRGTGFLYVRKNRIADIWPIWASWSGKAANSIEKYEDFGTVSKAVSASLPSVFDFNHRIGAARKEARLRYLRNLWLDEISTYDRVTLLTNPRPAFSCAIGAFQIDGIAPDKLAQDFREHHQLLIGSIHLQDKPDFTGNYLAAGLTNSEEDVLRFLECFENYMRHN